MIKRGLPVVLCMLMLVAAWILFRRDQPAAVAERYGTIAHTWGVLLVEEAIARAKGPGDIAVFIARTEDDTIPEEENPANPILAGVRDRLSTSADYNLRLVEFIQPSPSPLPDQLPGLSADVFSSADGAAAVISLAGPPSADARIPGQPVILFSYHVGDAEAWLAARQATAVVIQHPRSPVEPLSPETRNLYFHTLDQDHDVYDPR